VAYAALAGPEEGAAAAVSAVEAFKEDWADVVRSHAVRGMERRLDSLAYERQKSGLPSAVGEPRAVREEAALLALLCEVLGDCRVRLEEHTRELVGTLRALRLDAAAAALAAALAAPAPRSRRRRRGGRGGGGGRGGRDGSDGRGGGCGGGGAAEPAAEGAEPAAEPAEPGPCGGDCDEAATSEAAEPRPSSADCEAAVCALVSKAIPRVAAQMRSASRELPGALPAYMPEECSSSGECGEWVNTVLATAPHLSVEGLREALTIFDRGIENLQQAKALDKMIASTCAAGGVFMDMPHLAAARTMRAQISQQQQILQYQLWQLRATKPAGTSSASRSQEAGDLVQRMSQLRQKADQPVAQPASQQARRPGPGQQWGDRAPQRKGPAPRGGGGAGSAHAGRPEGAAPRPPMSETTEDSLREMQPEGERRPAYTLSSCLQLLSTEDPSCLMIVRRINKLGFKVGRKLKKHFSAYGSVVRVLVAHSTVAQGGSDKALRQRPSSLGFVHMSTPAATQAILAVGSEQDVEGVTISVQRFERSSCEGQDLEGASVKDRQSSDAGTSAATTGAASSRGMGSSQADSEEKGDTSEKADSSEKADDSSEKADSEGKGDSEEKAYSDEKADSEGKAESEE
ncbi:unnamed protein product, partial [Prorocentrum cordatum]